MAEFCPFVTGNAFSADYRVIFSPNCFLVLKESRIDSGKALALKLKRLPFELIYGLFSVS